MLKSLDRSVGSVLKKLRETGLEENTLLIFMSDNGGIDSKLTPKGKGTDNSPFLGGKATLNEGGIRVPLVLYWKGKVKPNQWVDVPVDATDIFPTVLDLAGFNSQEIAKMETIDGQSILPLLDDIKNSKGSYTKTTRFWHYPFNVIYKSPYDGYPLNPHSAIREGDYKLIFDWFGRLYLYDIENDPYEKNNLAEENPELFQNLFKKLKDWMHKNVEDRYMPKLNPDYNPEKEVRKEEFLDLYNSEKV